MSHEYNSFLRQRLEQMVPLLPPSAPLDITINYIDNRGDIQFGIHHACSAKPISEPRHLKLFLERPLEYLSSCPLGCCMAAPLDNGCLLTLASAKPLSAESTGLARLLLHGLSEQFNLHNQNEELRQQIDFSDKILRSMSSGFVVLLPDLTVRDANPAACALLQTAEDKLIGAKLSNFVLSELQVKKVFATGEAITDQESFIKLKHKTLHILKTAVPVKDKDGKVIAVLDHFREIKEAHKLVSRMTGARASFTFSDLIHESPSMSDAIELARMASTNTLSVLISGESGTGKELFAHAIHQASSRCDAPFVVIDCASMPRELVASELFGYTEGAFTGARRGGMLGKFELADGGTVFLDELGELPQEVQAQFLRVLQTRQVVRLGGKAVIPVDIRIIAATNRNLEQEVLQGGFREDLFYRLNVLSIHIPPLRSRSEDIAPLAAYFTQKYCSMVGKSMVSLSPEALALLQRYSWPGNVRELENIIARAVHICADTIKPEHIMQPRMETNNVWPTLTTPSSGESYRDTQMRAFQDAILACGGNISQAARRLGVARSTIYKRISVWEKHMAPNKPVNATVECSKRQR